MKMTNDEVKAFMKKHNLGSIELAQLLGLTRPAIDHWITGRRAVPTPVIKLLRVIDQYPQLLPWIGALK